MIDLRLLKTNYAPTVQSILSKDPLFPIELLATLYQEVTAVREEVEKLRNEKNNLSKITATPSKEQIENSRKVGEKLKEKERILVEKEKELSLLAAKCPNLPSALCPVGGKEANKVVRSFGEKPAFSFSPLNHVELNKKACWFDMEKTSHFTGSQFVTYKGYGLKVIYYLCHLLLKHNMRHGFTPILPPYVIREEGLFNSGNLPKFAGDYYKMEADNLCLIPTAEVSITNIHAKETYKAEELPLRNTAWTGCFRREAGTYGAKERGLIRVHQFEKVEVYSVCTQENSAAELEHITNCAEKILQELGLCYQVSLLATQDSSFQAAITYDIEAWLPGQGSFYEVSSCSNCTDFQARRAHIRYTDGDKSYYAHTLNGSSLALSRLIVALMETYQTEEGTVKLPSHLTEKIEKFWE